MCRMVCCWVVGCGAGRDVLRRGANLRRDDCLLVVGATETVVKGGRIYSLSGHLGLGKGRIGMHLSSTNANR